MPRPDPAVTEFEKRLRAALDRFADELARLPPPPRLLPDEMPKGSIAEDERVRGRTRRGLTGRDLDRHVAVCRLMALVQASRKR